MRQWSELQDGIDCRLNHEDRKDNGDGTITCFWRTLGEPLLLTVQLRNSYGVDRLVPAEFVRKGAKQPAELHAGIQPRLWHAALTKERRSKNAEPIWQKAKKKSNDGLAILSRCNLSLFP